MKIIGCIPARYASTRLPGKPLCEIGGKAMVLHVVEKALQSKRLDDVVVLTDDERILNTVNNANYQAVMTSPDCASGTDRIADFMRHHDDVDIFVNIQGDEVLLESTHIDQLVDEFTRQTDAWMGTLAHNIHDTNIMGDPNSVKVVIDQHSKAMYFSRNCIPVKQTGDLPENALIHIGVYIYTRKALEKLTSVEQTPLERTEKLEQLRALEHGIPISVTVVDNYQSLSVDTEADLQKARELFGT